MTADWMKSLEALRETLPEGEEAPQEETGGGREDAPAGQPRLDVVLDKKNRKGKAATIVAGFTFSDSEVAAVAARLKQKLGTGGSARGGEILIQGDKRQQVLEALVAMGFKARII